MRTTRFLNNFHRVMKVNRLERHIILNTWEEYKQMLTLHQPIPEHNPLSHCCPGVHLEQAVPLMYGSSLPTLPLK
jgi:hypothetical protein